MHRKFVAFSLCLLLLSGCKDVDECLQLVLRVYPGIKILHTVDDEEISRVSRVTETDIRFAYALKIQLPDGVSEQCEIGSVLVDREGGMDDSDVGVLEPIFRLHPDICDLIPETNPSNIEVITSRLREQQEKVDREAYIKYLEATGQAGGDKQ